MIATPQADARASRLVFASTAIVLLALDGAHLADPPYWDALIGSFPQGLWLARNDFDLWRLWTVEPGCKAGGPNVYPFSVHPLLIGALYAARLPPSAVFVVLHLVSLLGAAVCAAAVHSVARARLPRPLDTLVTLLLVCTPLFQSMASQTSAEMPLCAAGALTLRALDRERFHAAAAWGAAALAIHPRGAIVVAASLVSLALRARVGRARGAGSRTPRAALVAHLGLIAVAALQLGAHGTGAQASGWWLDRGGWSAFWRQALERIPDYGGASVAALATCAWICWRRSRSTWTELHLAAFLVTFLAFFSQFSNPLPRYALMSYPHVLLLVASQVPRRRAWTLSAAALLGVASVVECCNRRGALYAREPSGWNAAVVGPEELPANDGHVLERSLEYRDDLALIQAVARRIDQEDPERTVIVANWPLLHALALPELGYVARARRTSSQNGVVSFDPLAIPFRELYDTGVRPVRRRIDVDVVWVATPNVYLLPNLALQARLDERIEVIEVAGRKAFVFRRAGWEPK